jgi:hypothetical protein
MLLQANESRAVARPSFGDRRAVVVLMVRRHRGVVALLCRPEDDPFAAELHLYWSWEPSGRAALATPHGARGTLEYRACGERRTVWHFTPEGADPVPIVGPDGADPDCDDGSWGEADVEGGG